VHLLYILSTKLKKYLQLGLLNLSNFLDTINLILDHVQNNYVAFYRNLIRFLMLPTLEQNFHQKDFVKLQVLELAFTLIIRDIYLIALFKIIIPNKSRNSDNINIYTMNNIRPLALYR